MGDNSIIESLNSEEAKKLIPQIYQDLLQPGIRQVGAALESVLSLTNTIALPAKLLSEKASFLFQKHMQEYRRKLESIPLDHISDVPTEIGLPILDRLIYTTNEEIADLFTTLLAKASDDRTASAAHPGFVRILEGISVDEARIIKYLGKGPIEECTFSVDLLVDDMERYEPKWKISHDTIYYISVINPVGARFPIPVHRLFNRTDIEFKIELNFPDNIPAYLDNLSSMGVLRHSNVGENCKKQHEDILNNILRSSSHMQWVKTYEESFKAGSPNLLYSRYSLTEFGELFVAACNQL